MLCRASLELNVIKKFLGVAWEKVPHFETRSFNDVIDLSQVTAPIMKGTTSNNELFLLFKLVDKLTQSVFAVYYAPVGEKNAWVQKGLYTRIVFAEDKGFYDHLETMSVLVSGDHEHYVLYNG
jgi:hypothetical protein